MKKLTNYLGTLSLVLFTSSLLLAQIPEVEKYDTTIFDSLIFKSGKVTSNETLNTLFNKNLNSLLSNSGNISTNKGQVFYNPEDDKVYLGGLISNIKNSNEKLNYIGQVSLSLPVAKNFASITDTNNKSVTGLGISLKATKILKGTLRMGKKSNGKGSDALLTQNLRNKREIIKKELLQDNKRDIDYATKTFDLSDSVEVVYLNKKIISLKDAKRKEFIAREIEELEGKKGARGYNGFFTWWVSGELDFGVTEIEQLKVENLMSSQIDTMSYLPFRSELNLGGILSSKWIDQLYGRMSLGLEDMTIVQARSMDPKTISFFSSQAPNIDSLSQAVIKEKKVFANDLSKFTSRYINFDATIFPSFLKHVGFRVAFKRLFFKYEEEKEEVDNWTIAIPFVFNDKDGKPNVKFEFQWRNRNGNKNIGFSAGIPIGGSIFN